MLIVSPKHLVATDREFLSLKVILRVSNDSTVISIQEVTNKWFSDFRLCLQALSVDDTSICPIHDLDTWIPGSESLKAERSIMLKRKLNSVGARTHPCLTPLVTGNSSSSLPLTNLAFMPLWKHLIILTTLGGIPIGSMLHSPGRDTVSNALVRSTKTI